MRMRGPTASFWLAFLIVSAATVALIVTPTAHPGEWSEWPRLAVPIKPPFLLVYAFGGGPHGRVAGEWWYDGPVTFVVALAMWWAVLEGCRRLRNLRRR
jgi:hypothetical protein